MAATYYSRRQSMERVGFHHGCESIGQAQILTFTITFTHISEEQIYAGFAAHSTKVRGRPSDRCSQAL